MDRGGLESHFLGLIQDVDPAAVRWLVVSPSSARFRTRLKNLGAASQQWEARFPIDIRRSLWLRHLLRQHEIDILHAHDLRSSLVGGPTAKLLGIHMLRTVHFPEYFTAAGDNLRAKIRRKYYQWLERIANHYLVDHVIFVSKRIREEAIQTRPASREQSTVIANGVDLSAFDAHETNRIAIRELFGVDSGERVMSFVGRLDHQKGLDILLTALSRLRHGLLDHAWIIGDGPLRDSLEARSSELGLSNFIRFMGWREDLPELLSASDLFVLPSRYDGLPFALLQAMACRLACVVTDVGESGELVRGSQCGRVVEPEDPNSLKEAIEELVSDEEIRENMGLAGREAALRFSRTQMAAQTVDLYQKLLS